MKSVRNMFITAQRNRFEKIGKLSQKTSNCFYADLIIKRTIFRESYNVFYESIENELEIIAKKQILFIALDNKKSTSFFQYLDVANGFLYCKKDLANCKNFNDLHPEFGETITNKELVERGIEVYEEQFDLWDFKDRKLLILKRCKDIHGYKVK